MKVYRVVVGMPWGVNDDPCFLMLFNGVQLGDTEEQESRKALNLGLLKLMPRADQNPFGRISRGVASTTNV
jgi:hypothetical protein